jgi:uncharacterized protein YbjT (DUF2867 family)
MAMKDVGPVTIVGGTGFIGRRLVERLIGDGIPVRIVSRHAQAGGSTPQIEHVTGSIEDAFTIKHAIVGASAVVDLVGTTAAKKRAAVLLIASRRPATTRRSGASCRHQTVSSHFSDGRQARCAVARGPF